MSTQEEPSLGQNLLRSMATEALIGELVARITEHGDMADPNARDHRVQQKLIEALVATYPPGQPGALVAAVAQVAEVGVAYTDRDIIEDNLQVKFTDEQWDRVAWNLDSFDEWLSLGTSFSDFHDQLLDRAGLRVDDDGEDGPVVVEVAQVSA